MMWTPVALLVGSLFFCSLSRAASLYTNLALNPNDVHDWTPANGYPHATSNSEYPAPFSQPPNPEYYALNAIDGKTANSVETQDPAWGPDTLRGLWWMVDFGKSVQIDSVVLWIRADWTTTAPIPHDSYWKSGTLVFSDSSKVNIVIDSTAGPQGYKFASRVTNSLTITNLVPHVLHWRGWCALAEVQAWGYDTPTAVNESAAPSATILPVAFQPLFLASGLSLRSIRTPAHVHGVEVYTILGRKVMSFANDNPTSTFSFSSPPRDCAQGVYLLRYLPYEPCKAGGN